MSVGTFIKRMQPERIYDRYSIISNLENSSINNILALSS